MLLQIHQCFLMAHVVGDAGSDGLSGRTWQERQTAVLVFTIASPRRMVSRTSSSKSLRRVR